MLPDVAPAPTDARRFLELLAVFVLALSLLGLLLARLGGFDAPPVWIGGLLAVFAYHRASLRFPLGGPAIPAWHLVLVVLAGLLFRLTPDAYVLGGQDQGIYLNTAMELARAGQLTPSDPVLARITDPAVLEAYRRSNYTPDYLPGVYAVPGGLQFQFYHLFQVWLALFGDGFGPQAAVYGLTFLSLVSLLFFYRLAQLLTGSATAGLVAGLLLAANPLHAFFSRFPVTEVPTLAFSAMAFALLAEYHCRMGEGERRVRLLVLSVAALASLFLTRISGFMYLPFLAALVAAGLLFDADRLRRRDLVVWGAAVLAAYGLSVAYGLRWSERYATDIYRLSFAPLLGANWPGILVAASIAGLVALAFLAWSARRPAFAATLQRLAVAGTRVLPVLVVAIVILGAYRAYRLGYTDAYATDPWAGLRFGLSNQGLRSVLSTSLAASAVYLSPFVFAFLIPAAFMAVRSSMLALLLAFVTLFFFIVVVLQGVLAYQPYFARYLLSEFVPYALLLVVCAWSFAQGRARKLFSAALCLGAVFSGGLALAQVGKNEHEGVAESLAALGRRFDRGDLVLIEKTMASPASHELKTALVYTLGLNVATVSAADMAAPAFLQRLGAPYDDVYLLATSADAKPGFQEVESVRFTERAFSHGAFPPVALVTRTDSRIRILRWRGPERDPMRLSAAFGHSGGAGAMLTSGWSSPEPWGTWSNAGTARLTIDLSALPAAVSAQRARLRLSGRAFVSAQAPIQRIALSAGGQTVATTVAGHPRHRVELVATLPAESLRGDKLVLDLALPDAISPRALGLSADGRALSFGLETLELDLAAEGPAGPVR